MDASIENINSAAMTMDSQLIPFIQSGSFQSAAGGSRLSKLYHLLDMNIANGAGRGPGSDKASANTNEQLMELMAAGRVVYQDPLLAQQA